MSTYEVLVKARELIEDPQKWCGHGWGNSRRRCAVHALDDVAPSLAHRALACREVVRLVDPKARGSWGVQLGNFNDSHSHAEVLAAFDRAITSCAPASREEESG